MCQIHARCYRLSKGESVIMELKISDHEGHIKVFYKLKHYINTSGLYVY